MQPRPRAETTKPLLPSVRLSMVCPPWLVHPWPRVAGGRRVPSGCYNRRPVAPVGHGQAGCCMIKRAAAPLGAEPRLAQSLHRCWIAMVEEAAGLGVQRGDRRHVVRAQLDVEHVEVLRDPFWADRL